jgi:hypothetical protein
MSSLLDSAALLDFTPLALSPGEAVLPDRLSRYVRRVASDAAYRRRLAVDPSTALTEHFALVPGNLDAWSAPTREPDILFNQAQIFGGKREAPQSPATIPFELRMLVYGTKPAALLHGRESDLEFLAAWSRERGFTALFSPHEWEIAPDDGKGGYANLLTQRRRARAGSNSDRSLIVAPDTDLALLGWLALTYDWDALMGRVLGYPPCCAQAFDQRWPDAAKNHSGDVAAIALREAGPGPHPWQSNVMGRYFGYELIQHFPCKPTCSYSVAQGRAVFEALALHEPEHAQLIKAVLSSPVLFTERDGIAVLPGATPSSGQLDLHFDAATAVLTQDGALANAIKASQGKVTIMHDGSSFTLAETQMEGVAAVFADAENELDRS